jgi:RNA polymerase sigma factor (sigma-70 family)
VSEDQRLVSRIQEGDTSAWEVLIHKYYQSTLYFCYRRTGDQQTAEDLTHDIFLKLLSSLERYRYTGKFSNYLYTIALNTCRDFFKKKGLYIEETEHKELEDTGDLPEEVLIKKERAFLLFERLASLPDVQKDAIVLYYFQGEKLRDIALMTQTNLSTVKTRIRRALQTLRTQYEQEKKDEDAS